MFPGNAVLPSPSGNAMLPSPSPKRNLLPQPESRQEVRGPGWKWIRRKMRRS